MLRRHCISHLTLGRAFVHQGKPVRWARDVYDPAIERAETWLERDGDAGEAHRLLSIAHVRMGDAARQANESEMGEEQFERGLAHARPAVEALDETDSDDRYLQWHYADALLTMGRWYRDDEQWDEARSYYERALDRYQWVVEHPGDRPDVQRDIAITLEEIRQLFEASGDDEEARRCADRLRDHLESHRELLEGRHSPAPHLHEPIDWRERLETLCEARGESGLA